METQKTINAWAEEAFGHSATSFRTAERADEEMTELLNAFTESPLKVPEEAADVVIVLFILAHRAGFDLMEEVDKKMQINRSRKWKKDSTGVGYHIKE